MTDCLFCKIVAGDVPSRQVYADDLCVAFLDVAPAQRGHTLVVPRRHVADALADATVLASLAPAVTHVGSLLLDKLKAQGMNVLSNVGEVAGQSVHHLHVHLIPRYVDDPGLAGLTHTESAPDLDAVLAAIKA